MKNKRITILLIVINIILVGIICNLISKNGNIVKEKQIIKEMTETEYDNSINTLNKSHEDYALQVQENKIKIASAISDMGVATSENATADVMASNIKSISGASIKSGKTDTMIVTSGSSNTINVTFEDEFNAVPNVIVSPVYDYNSSTNGYCDTMITSITTSGFNVRFSNNSNASRTLYISWIAIEQK